MKIELSSHFFNELKWILFFVFVLNVLDGVLTIISVLTFDAVEINPLMSYLISCHPVLFMICKQFLFCFGSVILWRFRKNILAVFSIFVIFLVYYITIIHQLRMINRIFPGLY